MSRNMNVNEDYQIMHTFDKKHHQVKKMNLVPKGNDFEEF